MKRWLILILLAGAGVWLYLFLNRPFELPRLKMKDAQGQVVELEQMYQGRENLLVVFVLPGCPISEFSLGMLKGLYPRFSEKVAFVGLIHGNYQTANEMREKFELPFPIYGLRDAADPFAVNALFEKVGGGRITGGTVVVADGDRKAGIVLAGEDLIKLAEKLEDLP